MFAQIAPPEKFVTSRSAWRYLRSVILLMVVGLIAAGWIELAVEGCGFGLLRKPRSAWIIRFCTIKPSLEPKYVTATQTRARRVAWRSYVKRNGIETGLHGE